MSRAMHWAIWWLAGKVFYLGETASLLNRSARFISMAINLSNSWILYKSNERDSLVPS